MIQEKIFGNIGLNLDDDPRYFSEDDTDLIQNMLPDMDGDAGLLATHPGNTEIPTGIDWLITATQKVIGSCKRIENDTIYYFVKGMSIHGSDITTTTTTAGFDYDDALDNEYNSIIEFDPLTNTFRKIVFEEEFLYMGDWVYGAKVFGEYIIYNSGLHGMRKVHIEYAYRYYNSVAGPTYPTITSTTFALRNLPPMDRPTIAYDTDASELQNLIIGKTFQFAYRYKYVDAGYSVYSPYSEVAYPQGAESWNGDLVGPLYMNNVITVGFERGDLDIVEFVEIIVKDGADGDWRLFTTITDNVSSVDFFNDESYESVDQDEVLKVEDAIPLQVADGTLINDNRIVVARPTEGFDNIELDVNLSPVREPVTIVTPVSPVLGDVIDIIPQGAPQYLGAALNTSDINMADGYAEGDYMVLEGTVVGNAFSESYTLTASDVADKAGLIAAIQSRLGFIMAPYVSYIKVLTVLDPAAIWNTDGDTNDTDDIEIGAIDPDDYIAGTVSFIDQTIAAPDLNKWNTYKSASTHAHGIEYFDSEFRRSTVQCDSSCLVDIRDRNGYAGDSKYRIYLNWRIAHLAPSWARYWRWVYAGNKNQASFVQYVISGTNAGLAEPWTPYLGLDITPLQTLKTSSAPNVSMPKSIIDPYVFTPGDRVKIITQAAVAGDYGPFNMPPDFYDLPVMGFTDYFNNYLLVPMPAAGTYGAEAGSLIEIYSPRTFEEGSELYFPVGPINEVYNGLHLNSDTTNGGSQGTAITISGTANNGSGLVRFATAVAHGLAIGDWVRIAGTTDHNGDWQITDVSDGTHFDISDAYNAPSQTGTATPLAYGRLESGDAFVIARAFSENIGGATDGTLFHVESMHWSDFYISDHYDRGKPNIYSAVGEVTQNNIRWGNKHLTGASINNMFTFDALDYKSTTEIYGTITRIGEIGDVLKVLFQRKVASMYVGKAEFMDTNGSAVLSVSDNILSNPNYSLEDYGTTVPQAVIFVRGFCYFIDLYNGAIIRNGNNGSYPISGKVDAGGEGADYKMHRYFRDLCSTVLRDEDAYTMLLGWDDGRKLLYVSILGTAEERTLAFRESRGRWVCFLDFYEDLTGYYPTCYEWAGDKFYSFLNYSDSVWDHASATSTPLNIYGEAKTAYVNVWGQQHPNKVKVFDSISVHTDIKEWAGNVFIPVSLSYPNGMESRLPMAGFVRRENGLHAGYLFNALTDNGVFAPPRLYNGESLRGYMINNQLYTEEEAKLFKVDINFRISNL